uniref:Ig-like domain-containing protein n=1 Tax=Erpetoichthys calabaricus TaxID=27687 RepID=A0A8C4T7K4_ERPCA
MLFDFYCSRSPEPLSSRLELCGDISPGDGLSMLWYRQLPGRPPEPILQSFSPDNTFSYSYLRAGEHFTMEQNHTLVIRNVTREDVATYYCSKLETDVWRFGDGIELRVDVPLTSSLNSSLQSSLLNFHHLILGSALILFLFLISNVILQTTILCCLTTLSPATSLQSLISFRSTLLSPNINMLIFSSGKINIAHGYAGRILLNSEQVAKGNFSLVLLNIQKTDEGNYRCYPKIATFYSPKILIICKQNPSSSLSSKTVQLLCRTDYPCASVPSRSPFLSPSKLMLKVKPALSYFWHKF